ncbi:hypothetical protein SKAU_G00414900 [Synaphobranchus kaupii]|uniref:ribonuclease H n=1 Tax=Synaphobranchus kaupii TaxID=118154 RepID=A0A9Q1IBD1_SYNKA|nr:hypothetical protein SKAU_G00414900 [Synaphobranchus kaupii]
MKKVVSLANPKTADKLMEAVERHQITMALLKVSKGERPPSAKEKLPPANARNSPQPERLQREVWRGAEPRQAASWQDSHRCHRCGELGYISWNCPVTDEPMPTEVSDFAGKKPCGLVFACLGRENPPLMVTAHINGRETPAMIDTGSMVTLAQPHLVAGLVRDHEVSLLQLSCIHGDLKEYPTAGIDLRTDRGHCHMQVGIVPTLPVPMLIGRDCPLYSDLWKGGLDPNKAVDQSMSEEADDEGEGGGPHPRPAPSAARMDGSQEDWMPTQEQLPIGGQFGTVQLRDPNLTQAQANEQVLDGTQEAPKEAVSWGPELSCRQRQDLQERVDRNEDVFSDIPGKTSVVMHEIHTEPGKIVRQKPYRIPEARRKTIEVEVEQKLKLGVTEKSNSAWSSLIVLVPKPNGSVRFCNDFRRLNEVSKFDAYPMPRVDKLIDRLGVARFITTLDLTRGYWQVPLAPEAREKPAFATPGGLYHYKVLPFSLFGAGATFQS